MINATKLVEKKGITRIREFIPMDIGMLLVKYASGFLPQIPKNLGVDKADEHIKHMITLYTSHWVVEDSGEPIGTIFMRTDGWLIEPHVEFFKGVSTVAIYRAYLLFFSRMQEEDMDGSCIVKCLKNNRNIFNKMVMQNVLLYVGEIPKGDPEGTLYLYCRKPKESE